MRSDASATPLVAIPVLRASSPPWSSNAAFFVLKLALAFIAIATIYFSGKFTAGWRQIGHLDPWFALAAAVAGMAQIGLGGLRWRYILIRLGAPLKALEALQLFYISTFFNTYVWGAVGGDVLRAWLTYRVNVSPANSAFSVILDRVAAIAGVALLMLVTMPWLAVQAGYNLQPFVLAATGGAILIGIVLVSKLEHLPANWRSSRIARLVHEMGSATRQALLKPAAVPVVIMAILAQLALGVMTYLLAKALAIEVSLLACVALMQPVALMVALPISIGGWGLREAGIIGLFALVNVSVPNALLLSVSLGVLVSLISLPGGLVWLLWRSCNAEERSSPLKKRQTRGGSAMSGCSR
jgi:glycosyltransferase 2 family protein